MGVVRLYSGPDMMWWEEERLLTEKDKAAITLAKSQDWTEIDEASAETVVGRKRLHDIRMRKYHYEEYKAEQL